MKPDKMRNEGHVKAEVKKLLTAIGAWYTMPFQAGYTQAGVPDILVCWRGRFVGIETKFGYNKPTALQERQLQAIQDAGGVSLVVSEKNIEQLYTLLEAEK